MKRLGMRARRPMLVGAFVLVFAGGIVVGLALPSCGRRPAAKGPARAPAATVPDVAPPLATYPWATAIERPGLPNFHKVSDSLYRGAQPTAEGFRELK
ncbi:unnamed protein product, partial [marine sediment metagenome]